MNVYNMRIGDFGLSDLVNAAYARANHPLVMVEIGSYAGQSMEIFAKTQKFSKILCVDPWQKNYDSTDPASSTDMDVVEQIFDSKALAASSFAQIIKHKGTIDTFVTSNEFAKLDHIDLVYIDANHQYEFVKHDIWTSLTILKPLIAISGHDYSLSSWLGVSKAVHEVVGVPDMTFSDTSWIKFLHNDLNN